MNQTFIKQDRERDCHPTVHPGGATRREVHQYRQQYYQGYIPTVDQNYAFAKILQYNQWQIY